jgi:hypothetical protein
LDNADVCCQFFACLTQFYNQLMSKHHKEACICIVRKFENKFHLQIISHSGSSELSSS